MKMKYIHAFYLYILCCICISCSEQPTADLIVINGNIYTVAEPTTGNAIAIQNGNIIEIGSNEEMEKKYKNAETEIIDAEGNFVMPGFIEGHGHFSGLGSSLINLNLLKTKSWEEIVNMVKEKVKDAKPGEWIVGRGWHQEKWTESPGENIHGYPYHNQLSEISPNNPVILRHASGHGAFANETAMEISGVSNDTPDPKGGEIVRDEYGKAIGMFEERAMAVIYEALNEYNANLSQDEIKANWYKGIEAAEVECLTKGITSFQDAGSKYYELDRYEEMAKKGELDIRLWAMARHSSKEMKNKVVNYKKIGVGNNFFTCRALKTEVDGALGSFGAWLIKSYADKFNFVGQNTTDISEVDSIAHIAVRNGMQLCVHAIGDRANHEVLNIIENAVEKYDLKAEELRWRIEHAQHLDTLDIPRFKELSVIASMQGIHCTSDAPFVEKRLGEERSRLGAYPWRSLLDNGVIIANGTDAPVEDVDPIESYYASVTRKRADSGLEFFPEQRMTRQEAIHSYTLGNAYAAFEESYKGSLEVGKVADIVILSKDLIQCTDEEILETEILYTIVNGVVKHKL